MSSRSRRCIGPLAFASLLACGSFDAEDAGSPDASTPDASTPEVVADGTDCGHCRSNRCDVNGNCYALAFVTKATHNGDLGGRAAADGCDEAFAASPAASHVQGASPPGRFVAWLNIKDASAYLHVSQGKSVQRVVVDASGEKIMTSYAQLAESTPPALLAPLKSDEMGAPVDEGQPVWTGDSSSQCHDWTVSGNNAAGVVGFVGYTDIRWTNADRKGCANPAHLYCFEVIP